MKLKNLSILCATAILSMATASAELTLPINLDFEQQDILKGINGMDDYQSVGPYGRETRDSGYILRLC